MIVMLIRKISVTVVLVICLCVLAFGQDSEASPESETRSLYLGLGTGINAYTGLIGITGEFNVVKPVSIVGALGIGSWGTKSSIGLRFYPHYPNQWAFTVSYSHCSGIKDVDVKFEEDFVKGQDGSETYKVDLLSINTVNISAMKHWLIGKRKVNRIHVELGYAIPTSSDRYRIGAELTDDGETFMRLLEPGGITIGTGFTFGLRP
jgi:hypothetical protein